MAYNIPACEEIAQIAYGVSQPMTFQELADMLGYETPHGVAKRISAAYNYYWYELKDEATANAISYAFVNKAGTYGQQG